MDYEIHEEFFTNYFEVMDGEIFCIQTSFPDDDEPSDQILMTRDVALQMAKDIIEMFGDNE